MRNRKVEKTNVNMVIHNISGESQFAYVKNHPNTFHLDTLILLLLSDTNFFLHEKAITIYRPYSYLNLLFKCTGFPLLPYTPSIVLGHIHHQQQQQYHISLTFKVSTEEAAKQDFGKREFPERVRTASMPALIITKIILSLALILTVSWLSFEFQKNIKDYRDNFRNIFSENNVYKTSHCVGMDAFLRSLEDKINQPNPFGIVFVTGRKNSGKTTVIKAALASRTHVAYINWRQVTIASDVDLTISLKKAFKVQLFRDYLKNFDFGLLNPFSKWILPTFTYQRQGAVTDDLSSTLDEIEEILKYAQQLDGPGVQSRPVIFIDEIGSMMPLVSGSDDKRQIGKLDKGLCDVIFASHDGFSLQILGLSDPLYVSAVTIPDLTRADMKAAVSLGRVDSNTSNSMYAANIDVAMQAVGGHAGHVLQLLQSTSQKDLLQRVSTFRLSEVETLDTIKNSKFFCSTVTQSCYDYTYFEDIMNLFVERRRRYSEDDPAIALITVLRETDIDRYNYLWGKDLGLRVVKHFVGLGFLFYDPEKNKLMARNKVMLDVFAMVTHTAKEMQHRKDKIQQWENSCGTTSVIETGDMGETDPESHYDCRGLADDKTLWEQELRELEARARHH
eukprot:gene25376-33124_t